MTSWLYLLSILGATVCMGLLDRRWRLFLFARPNRALMVLVTGIAFFAAWDLIAIGLEIYARGESSVMTGIELAPELPLEELFFITFLCYHTMVLHALVLHVLRHRVERVLDAAADGAVAR